MIQIPNDAKVGDRMHFSWITKEGKGKKTSDGYEVVIKALGDSCFCIHSVMGDYDMYFTKDLMERFEATCKKI